MLQMEAFQVPGTLQNVIIPNLIRSRMLWRILRRIVSHRNPGICFKASDFHTRCTKCPEKALGETVFSGGGGAHSNLGKGREGGERGGDKDFFYKQ